MLVAEVDDLQAELAATQAVAAKHQRTAAASGQEIKVLQRLSSSGDISFMRTHSQSGRRSTTGHRYSEQGIPSFGSHDDLIHLQVCSHTVYCLSAGLIAACCRSCMAWFTRSRQYLLARSLAHSLTHSLTHSLFYSPLTHSPPTRPLLDSLDQYICLCMIHCTIKYQCLHDKSRMQVA